VFTFQFLNDKIHNYVVFLTFTHEISQLRSFTLGLAISEDTK
jgi:hypothetical protein